MGRRALGVFGCVLLTLLVGGCPTPLTDAEKFAQDGNRLFQAGNYEAAEAAFDKAVELTPGEPGPLMNRGNARMMLGRNQAAMADYNAALTADDQFAKAYANRGILKDRLGDETGAMADYRMALELEPQLGKGPSIWQRILRNPPTETIRHRLEYLEARRRTEAMEPPRTE